MTKKAIRVSLICFAAIGMMTFNSCGYYPESVLYLAQSSELPGWVLNHSEIQNVDSIDDIEIKFEFYAPNPVLIYVSSKSTGLTLELEGQFSWIEQNVGGENGSNRYFSIVVDGEEAVFRQEIGYSQTIHIVPSDVPQPERKPDS